MAKISQKPKIMPHSIEAEQAILGCNLIDNDVPITVMSKLSPGDFYSEAHQSIFEAMQKIFRANSPIDFVTLTDELERMGIMDLVGGIDYITTLTNIVPSAANFNYYLEIVKRDSVLRNLIKASEDIIEKAYSSEEKQKVLGFAEKSIFDIAQKEDNSSLVHISDALKTVIDKFEQIAKDKDSIKGISTGFVGLDRITNGLQNSDLILVAARPGVGKTSFAMNIINYAATSGKKNCAVFNLEMPKEQLSQRSLCSISGVSMERALKGELTQSDWKAIVAGNKKLTEASIYIDDSSLNTPIDILSKCRRLKREHGLDLVMIDYLQLMNSPTRSKDANRQLEISEITRNLKIAAKELNVPIILLSQLSRAVETRKDHRPVLSDLRESGAIEQDADIVMFIYNPEQYNDIISEDPPGVCELIIAKHRNGALGTIKLRWISEITTFKDFGKDGNDRSFEASAPPPPPPPAISALEEIDGNIDDLI